MPWLDIRTLSERHHAITPSIGPISTRRPAYDLEEAIRLEASGVNRGAAPYVQRRLRQKVRQALESNSNLPAIAGVVGFEAKLVLLQELEVVP
jgi:hypothetical protein